MKKYACPHCGERTISPLKKAFAGTQKSKGVICPNCGQHCTNGMKSAVLHTVIDSIMLIIVIIFYFVMPSGTNFLYMAATIIIAYIVNRLCDAFLFPLAPSLRLDL